MYNIPSLDDVGKVVIDESVIRGDSEPLLVFQNSEPAARVRLQTNNESLPRLSFCKILSVGAQSLETPGQRLHIKNLQ